MSVINHAALCSSPIENFVLWCERKAMEKERKCEGVKYAFCYLSGHHHRQQTFVVVVVVVTRPFTIPRRIIEKSRLHISWIRKVAFLWHTSSYPFSSWRSLAFYAVEVPCSHSIVPRETLQSFFSLLEVFLSSTSAKGWSCRGTDNQEPKTQTEMEGGGASLRNSTSRWASILISYLGCWLNEGNFKRINSIFIIPVS